MASKKWIVGLVVILIGLLMMGMTYASVIDPTPKPNQVSPVSATGTIWTWDENTESDLAGYGVCWTYNAPFTPTAQQCKDLGNPDPNEWDVSQDPDINWAGMGDGDYITFGFWAYDTAGNESDYQVTMQGGGQARINFTQDAPPAMMGQPSLK